MPGRLKKAGLPIELARAVRKAAFALAQGSYSRIREDLTVEVREMLRQGRPMAEVRAALLNRALYGSPPR